MTVGIVTATAALALGPPVTAQTPVCSYSVVASYPHDPDAFTQGLLWHDGRLYESTGLYGESTLRRVVLDTGVVEQQAPLSSSYFGEGLTLWQDRLLQLTYLGQTCFIWDQATFAPLGTFSYSGQGWGLTHDGTVLIMSDGSSTLTFRDPDTFAPSGGVAVTDDGAAVDHLNELEWIRGEVFANRWLTDLIARIDPDTGGVIAWIDLTGLLDPSPPGADVLNGIAWDDDGERLFVTGKRWPTLYEIELVGCPEIRLFWNGFESGDTRRWSATSPHEQSGPLGLGGWGQGQ